MNGFIAELVEHRVGNTKVIGSIPVEARFSFGITNCNCLKLAS